MKKDNQGQQEKECCEGRSENCKCQAEMEAAMKEGCCGGGCCETR